MKLVKMAGGFAVLALAAVAAQTDPWSAKDLIQPEALAARLNGDAKTKPTVLFIGFPVLYRAAHIPGAVMVGPAAKPEGIEAMKEAVAKMPRNSDIVIYCGCCPFDHCPNVRPAFAELRKMGFTHVQVLSVPTNMAKDWIEKGLPVEKGAYGGK